MNPKHPNNQAACNIATEMTMAGYGVFPVYLKKDENGSKDPKYPRPSWRDHVVLDPPEVGAKWDELGWTNAVGVATGQEYGVVGIDIDVSKGKDGYAALKDAGIELPATPMRIRTWSGGMHYYFRAPAGVEIKNKQNCPVTGVDARGKGGHLYGPGSTLDDDNGPGYQLDTGCEIVSPVDLPLLPDEWVKLLTEERPRSATARVTSKPADVSEIGPSRYSEKGKSDMAALIDRQLDLARTWDRAPDGKHGIPHADDNHPENPSVRRISGIVSVMARWLGWDYSFALEAFLDAYLEGGRSDEHDVRTTFSSDWDNVPDRPAPDFQLVGEEHLDLAPVQVDPQAEEDEKAYRRQKANANATEKLQEETSGWNSEFVEDRWDREAATEEDLYLVRKLLMKGETQLLVGDSESGKTWFALDAALSVANGVEWVGGTDTRQGRVLYITGEGQEGLVGRAQAWARARGGNPHPPSLKVMSEMPPLYLRSAAEKLARYIADNAIDLVIIDTMILAFPQVNSGHSEYINTVCNRLTHLRKYRPKCAIWGLIHTTGEGKLPGQQVFKGLIFSYMTVHNLEDESWLERGKWKDFEKPTWGPEKSFKRVDNGALWRTFDTEAELRTYMESQHAPQS